jgi:hypothetical protein
MVLGRTAVSSDDIRFTLNLMLKHSQDIDKIGEALGAV